MAQLSEIESFNQIWANNLIDVFEWDCLFFCKYYTMMPMLIGLADTTIRLLALLTLYPRIPMTPIAP